MLLRLIFALAIIVLAGPAIAEGTRLARCVLEIDGKTYIDGPCSFWREDALGSFTISTFYRQIDYHTAVVLIGTDKAFGHWNKEPGSPLLRGKLGYLWRDGDCWANEHARLCTWTTGDPSQTELFAGRCHMGECQWFAIDDRLLIASNADGELFKVTVRGWVSFNAEPDYSVLDYDRPVNRTGGNAGIEYFFCSAKRPTILWQEADSRFKAIPLNVHHVAGVTTYLIAEYFAACHGEIPSDDNDLAREHAYVDLGLDYGDAELELNNVEDVLRDPRPAACAQYGRSIELSGIVSRGKSWRDDKQDFIVLKLDDPICVEEGSDELALPHSFVREVQIVGCLPKDYETARATIRGALKGASLMSYRRPALLVAECR